MEDASRDFDGFLISVLMFPGFIFPKSSLKCVLMIQEPNFELIDVDQETAQSTGSMLPENLLRKCAASRAARYGRLLSKTFEKKKKSKLLHCCSRTYQQNVGVWFKIYMTVC